jgi:hypothetical protein
MNHGPTSDAIHCPSGLFPRHDARMAELTEEINLAPTAREKAEAAESLLGEVSILLRCQDHDPRNLDCRLCRGFTELRRGAAELVRQAGRLEVHGGGARATRRPR